MAQQLKRLPTEKEAIEERLALELSAPGVARDVTTPSEVGLVEAPKFDTRRPQKLPTTTAALERGLAMEQEEAAREFKEAQVERGAESEALTEKFRERGIRIGGRVVARQQLDNVLKQQENVLGELTRISGLKDQVQIQQFQASVNNKLTDIRRKLLVEAQKMKLELQRRRASAAEKRALAGAFITISAAAVGGVVAGAAVQQAQQRQDIGGTPAEGSAVGGSDTLDGDPLNTTYTRPNAPHADPGTPGEFASRGNIPRTEGAF